MTVNHHFAAAFPEDATVFGACRPGYPDTAVTNGAVSEWIQFMKQRSIQRVICLLDQAQLAYYGDLLGQYRAAFGNANVFNFAITDYTKPSEHQLCEILLVLRGATEGGIKTVVHCSAGVGRTGAVLSAYLEQTLGHTEAKAEQAMLETGRSGGSLRSFDLPKFHVAQHAHSK
jgi:protein-tyrosine phosphatase